MSKEFLRFNKYKNVEYIVNIFLKNCRLKLSIVSKKTKIAH